MTPVMNPIPLHVALLGHVEACANAYTPPPVVKTIKERGIGRQNEMGMTFLQAVRHEWESSPTIADRMNKSRCYAFTMLRWLEKQGFVERSGENTKTRWRRK